MEKLKATFRPMYEVIGNIHLVDKCLIIFMFILLLQSAYTLFFNDLSTANNIDVVIRTSAAGIFGYFLSANFVCINCGKIPDKKSAEDLIRQGAQADGEMNMSDSEKTPPISALQIIIATAIGLFCLVMLIVYRNYLSALPVDTISSAESLATLSQFRDFVSGCVGFLVGCPTAANKSNRSR